MTFYRILANPHSETALRWAWRLGAVGVVCALGVQILFLASAHRTASDADLRARALRKEELRLKTENRGITSRLTTTIYLDDQFASDQYLASFVHQLGEAASDTLVNLVSVQAEPGTISVSEGVLEGGPDESPGQGPAASSPAANEPPKSAVSRSETEKPLRWERIPVTIRVTGTFAQLMDFLDTLCDLPRPVETTDVDLSTAGVDRYARVVTVQMRAQLTLHRLDTGSAPSGGSAGSTALSPADRARLEHEG